MADGGPPILPPSAGGDPTKAILKALELGPAEVQRVSAELKVLAQITRLEAQVIRLNDNGTVTLNTSRGEIDVRLPVQLQPGQTVQVRLEAGSPPQVARLTLPPQPAVTTPETVQNSQQAQTVQQPPAQTVISPQASQRFDLPPIPYGTPVPTQFVPLPIPPTQTGIEVLLTTLFNTGAGQALTASSSVAPQQNPLVSLAQLAQATIPPPILEGIKNVQLLKTAFVGRQFNPIPLLNTLYGTQSSIQPLPVTGLKLATPPSLLSSLVLLNNGATQQTLINTEKPINGVSTILSSLAKGEGKVFTQGVHPQISAPARILFSQAPGKILQIPNFPIATTPSAGQANSLFFGVNLGQTPAGDFNILGTNGIATIPKQSVTGPLLPGTVLIAQGAGITPSPNLNLFNIPTIALGSGLLNFDPLLGDGWPVLDEVLSVLNQVDPAYAGAVRQSVPNVSNPAQLPSAILFFITATGIGDVRTWIGDKAFETLMQAGRTELSTLLSSDFTAIASRASEQTPDGWRPFMVPMFFGETLHRMQFFTRHHDDGGDGDDTSGKQTRFLVNVTQTKLGPIQIDGLVNQHRLDIVLRSDDLLAQDIRQGIRQHYSNALKETGLAGAISFEHGEKQWVEVDTTPTIDQSVFI